MVDLQLSCLLLQHCCVFSAVHTLQPTVQQRRYAYVTQVMYCQPAPTSSRQSALTASCYITCLWCCKQQAQRYAYTPESWTAIGPMLHAAAEQCPYCSPGHMFSIQAAARLHDSHILCEQQPRLKQCQQQNPAQLQGQLVWPASIQHRLQGATSDMHQLAWWLLLTSRRCICSLLDARAVLPFPVLTMLEMPKGMHEQIHC